MMCVQSLAPFLRQLCPADKFLELWPRVKGNVFTQVLIAWANEPFAMVYLADNLQPNAPPAVMYQALLDACRHILGETSQSFSSIAEDLSRQGVARTTGFLAAMIGLGVVGEPLTASVPQLQQKAGRHT
jgi:hypothetical protein